MRRHPEAEGPVDEEEVEVVELKVGEGLGEGLMAARLVALPDVVGLEQLRHDEELLPCARAEEGALGSPALERRASGG